MIKDNNKEYDLAELHSALLVLLKKFDSVCRKYDIKYSIAFGTLLGAVRHKGFIPWDDDVDILISRKNYEKLAAIPANEYGTDFFFQTVDTDPGYPYNTARLRLNNSAMIYEKWLNAGFNQGIYIDIIILDNIPDSFGAELFQKMKIIALTPFRFARNKNVFFAGGKNIPILLKKIMYALMKNFPLDKLYKREIKVEKAYSDVQTQRVAFIGEGNLILKRWYPTKPMPSEWFKDYCNIKFEDTELMCSSFHINMLEKWYGDYMKLPPKEKQVIYHQPLFCSAKVSYADYIKGLNEKK